MRGIHTSQPLPPFGAFFTRRATSIGTEWSVVVYLPDDDPPDEDEIIYCEVTPRLDPPDNIRIEP